MGRLLEVLWPHGSTALCIRLRPPPYPQGRHPAHRRVAWLLRVHLTVDSKDRDSISVVLCTTGDKGNINHSVGCTEAAWQEYERL